MSQSILTGRGSQTLIRPDAAGRRFEVGLLDVLAAAGISRTCLAYAPGLRLTVEHAGPAIRLRRTSDGAERDFTPEEVQGPVAGASEAALWAGASAFSIVQLYTQGRYAGQPVHLAQTTPSAQPLLDGSGRAVRSSGSVSPSRWLGASPPVVTARTLYVLGWLLSVPGINERIAGTSSSMASWQANAGSPVWRWRGSNLTTIGGDCTRPAILVARLSAGVTTVRVVQAGYDSGIVAPSTASGALGAGSLGLHAGQANGAIPSSSRVPLVLSWPEAHTDAQIDAIVAIIRRVYPLA